MKTTRFTLAIILSLTFGLASAQIKTIDLLTDAKWEAPTREQANYSFFINFSTNKRISTLIVGKETVKYEDLYYLSNNIDTVFLTDKVGKASNGKYIISKNTLNNKVEIYEIIQLDKNKLVLQLIHNHIVIGGGPVTYIAIPNNE